VWLSAPGDIQLVGRLFSTYNCGTSLKAVMQNQVAFLGGFEWIVKSENSGRRVSSKQQPRTIDS
jgi:hypothetical protein